MAFVRFRRLRHWAAFVFVLALAACGGGGTFSPASSPDGGNPPASPDTTAPALAFSTSSPLAVTASITVTADEDLAASASSWGVVVRQANGIEVPGTVSMAADHRSFSWAPSAAMAYSTDLSVTASAQDASGNRKTITQAFATVAPPPPAPPPADTTPPVLSLASASARIPVSGTITVASNEPLADGPDVSGAINDPRRAVTSAIVAGTAVLSADRMSIAWTPTGTLWYDAVLALRVTAADLAGNTTTFSVTLTTELQPAPAGWPPGTIFATQTRVTNPNQLPTGCEPFTTACWQQSVANGTVKFLDAGGAARENRSLVYAFFRRAAGAQNAGQAVLAALWLDNGVAAPNGLISNMRAGGGPLDMVYILVNQNGSFIIAHEQGLATCGVYEFPWSGAAVPPLDTPCP